MSAQPVGLGPRDEDVYALMSTFIVGRAFEGLDGDLANALRPYLGSLDGYLSDTFIVGEPGTDAEGSLISISLWNSRETAREASASIARHLRSAGSRQKWVDPIVYLYQVHP